MIYRRSDTINMIMSSGDLPNQCGTIKTDKSGIITNLPLIIMFQGMEEMGYGLAYTEMKQRVHGG